MKLAHDMQALPARAPLVLAAGSFDGLHQGHQALMSTAARKAAAVGGEAWVLTFEPHPARVLAPEKAPPLLTSRDEKLRLIADLGMDGVLELAFTPSFAETEAEAFVAQLVAAAPRLAAVVVGGNWHFGRRARGTPQLLRELGDVHGFETTVVEAVLYGDAQISSTRIRQAIGLGRMDQAAAMLGRPYMMAGPVVAGRKVGRKLGFPTANVFHQSEVVPPPGIYAVQAEIDGVRHPAAGYIATPGKYADHVVEVHLLRGSPDLYGKHLRVHFTAMIREDRHFADLDALKAQIASDVEKIRGMLG